MTGEEKEKIDYEIKAKADARNKEIKEWGCATFIAYVIFFIAFIVVKLYLNHIRCVN